MPVLQGIMRLLYGSTMLAGRHFAGEEYRGGFPSESVRGRPGCGVACRGGILRELVELTGLSAQVTAALADDTYRGLWTYAPGAVFTDLAAAVAGGADCIDGVGQRCGDREHVLRSGRVDWRVPVTESTRI